ncbi:TPA: hypothetical protein N3A45_004728, partial [Salmonella enterica subsp. salamae serovar [1],40:z35:e,n,x,z15]|nr:hypothetical protein [Salmonella enterica]HCM2001507.1 hypothetical protein [Salmonella enterica subsp. salamae serovar [1],40:z35:e,n,x,z15]
MTAEHGVIKVKGVGYVVMRTYTPDAAVILRGTVVFNSTNTSVSGFNTATPNSAYTATGLEFGYYANMLNMSVYGGRSEFYGESSGVGVLLESDDCSRAPNTVNVYGGEFSLTGKSNATIVSVNEGAGGIYTNMWDNYLPNGGLHIVLHDGANATLTGDASQAKGQVSGFSSFSSLDREFYSEPISFSGDGNVTISGKAQNGDGVNLRDFDNTGLQGSTSVIGESVSGSGVSSKGMTTLKLANASISGQSQNGTGILFDTTYKTNHTMVYADLNGNTLCGTTESGDAGVKING